MTAMKNKSHTKKTQPLSQWNEKGQAMNFRMRERRCLDVSQVSLAQSCPEESESSSVSSGATPADDNRNCANGTAQGDPCCAMHTLGTNPSPTPSTLQRRKKGAESPGWLLIHCQQTYKIKVIYYIINR